MSERHKGIVALIIVLVAWSISNLFVKYLLQNGYDPHTQNFYRYLAGVTVIAPFAWVRARRRGVQVTPRLVARLVVPAALNTAHTAVWVFGLVWVYPALASFLNKSSVFFAALMAFAFFPEERWLFRSGRFLSGLALTVFGTIGLILCRTDLHNAQINFGVLLVLLSAVTWALVSVSVKRVSAEVGPTVSFAVVGIFTTIALFVLALVWGDLGHWLAVPWTVNLMLVISGVLCIGIAHTLYYYCLRTIGVSVCAAMLLITPLGTMLLSRWLFGEKLATGQVIAGLTLLAGGALTLLAREKKTEATLATADV